MSYDNLFLRSPNNNIAYTHNGSFHADDVACGALLKYVFPDIEIRRVSTVPENAELAFDIGGGKYDHHKAEPELRENGVAYSSFGLLWRDLGPLCIAENYVREFDYIFVSKICYADTTGKANQISSTIHAMNPAWDSDKSSDECFAEAMDFMTSIFKIHFNRYASRDRGYTEVRSLIANNSNMVRNHTLILPKYIPYYCSINRQKILYVVYPTLRSSTDKAYTIHLTNLTREENREWFQRFPPEWDHILPPGTAYLKSDSHIVLNSKCDMLFAVQALEDYATEKESIRKVTRGGGETSMDVLIILGMLMAAVIGFIMGLVLGVGLDLRDGKDTRSKDDPRRINYDE